MAFAHTIVPYAVHEAGYTLRGTAWVPESRRLVAVGEHARGTGAFEIFRLGAASLEKIGTSTKTAPISCVTFNGASLPERFAAVGDNAGRLSLYDLEDMASPVWSVAAHKGMLYSVDGIGGIVGKGSTEFATGGADGCVRVWDPRQKAPVMAIEPDSEEQRDCWAVAFGDSHDSQSRTLAAGWETGDLRVFDLRSGSPIITDNLTSAIMGIEFDRRDIHMNKMVVTKLDGRFNVFDCRTKHPTEGWARLQHVLDDEDSCSIWRARHLPQSRELFCTTYGNGSVELWKYKYPEQRWRVDEDGEKVGVMGEVESLATAQLSTQPIAEWNWHRNKLGLAACTAFDETLRVVVVTRLHEVI